MLGYNEDTLLLESNRMKQIVSDELLREIRASIPLAWIIPQTEKRIDDIFKILRKRLSLIEQITEMIAEERRRAK